MRKKWMYGLVVVAVLAGAYLVGPSPATPVYDKEMSAVPADPAELERYIRSIEEQHQLKPDNEARIIWNDSAKAKTPFSVVYLHGFSASQEEGDPVHIDFARKFGCNLFLARLADHGVDTTEQLLLFTPDRLWDSGKTALAVGEAIGDRVILLSTSTGGTLALMLAAAYPEKVHALINMSPNIEINNSLAFMANNPWGNQIARWVIGSDYQVINYPPERQGYWNGKYRIEAIAQLQELLETGMTANTFGAVKCPTLTLYYYKNEREQDPTVRVAAMLKMHEQLGTPADQKREVAISTAGEHVLGSHLVSKDVPAVYAAIQQFAVDVLKLQPR
jgi:pimeloyl-ACP methyl ester carboxylesterase